MSVKPWLPTSCTAAVPRPCASCTKGCSSASTSAGTIGAFTAVAASSPCACAAMLPHAMPFPATLCHAVPCHAVLCHAVVALSIAGAHMPHALRPQMQMSLRVAEAALLVPTQARHAVRLSDSAGCVMAEVHLQGGDHGLRNLQSHALLGFPGARAQVRRAHHIRPPGQRVVGGRGLLREHVQRCLRACGPILTLLDERRSSGPACPGQTAAGRSETLAQTGEGSPGLGRVLCEGRLRGPPGMDPRVEILWQCLCRGCT